MRRKRKNIIVISLLLLCIIGIGFAYLSTNLTINGTANVSATTWNVHFDNLSDTTNASIDADKTTLTYTATLNKPGDSLGFTVDVVNEGTIDAMINSIEATEITESYLEYTYTYDDGVALNEKNLLSAGATETLSIKLKFKDDIESSDLPSDSISKTVTLKINYVQADDSANEVSHDSLVRFIAQAKAGNVTSDYLGTTFSVDLGTYGTHTLRVANTSTPSECSTTGFSQSACGVVLEFADIITTHVMNDTNTNVGGWPASLMYTFVNTDIYNALPETLRNSIINTTTVTGHGIKDTTNFTSTDKLYLLSTHEVWEDVDGNTSSGIDYYDTAYNNTRQLDYYSNLGVTTSSYSGAIKQNSGSNYYWWLRVAYSHFSDHFYSVLNTGDWEDYGAYNNRGVSPAFRIA